MHGQYRDDCGVTIGVVVSRVASDEPVDDHGFAIAGGAVEEQIGHAGLTGVSQQVIELRQDFTPTPGSQITGVSFWIFSESGFNAVDFFYTDNSDEEFVVSPPSNTWTFEDVTADVNLGKTLMGFSIFGADPSFTTFVDDASVTAMGGVPEPSTFAMLGGGTLALWGMLRRRLKG